jgi:hypothetical protein
MACQEGRFRCLRTRHAPRTRQCCGRILAPSPRAAFTKAGRGCRLEKEAFAFPDDLPAPSRTVDTAILRPLRSRKGLAEPAWALPSSAPIASNPLLSTRHRRVEVDGSQDRLRARGAFAYPVPGRRWGADGFADSRGLNSASKRRPDASREHFFRKTKNLVTKHGFQVEVTPDGLDAVIRLFT